MSTFIANKIEYREDGKIWMKGGDNNVVPRSNSWVHYDDKELFLSNLISGTIKITDNGEFARKVLRAFYNFETKHRKHFGERQDAVDDDYPKSINIYSLYQIRNYASYTSEQEFFNEQYKHLQLYASEYRTAKLNKLILIEKFYSEAVEFYIKASREFFNEIGIN